MTVQSRHLEDVHTLLELTELADVTYYKLHGEAKDDLVASPPAMEIQLSESTDNLMVRMNLEMSTEQAEYAVDAVVTYEFREPVTFEAHVRDDFVARVAVLALYPFLREAVVGLASKLRQPVPVLGLVRPGDIRISSAPDDSQGDTPSEYTESAE